jgi:hypothetical protein
MADTLRTDRRNGERRQPPVDDLLRLTRQQAGWVADALSDMLDRGALSHREADEVADLLATVESFLRRAP